LQGEVAPMRGGGSILVDSAGVGVSSVRHRDVSRVSALAASGRFRRFGRRSYR
jgi:hypothetical protein